MEYEKATTTYFARSRWAQGTDHVPKEFQLEGIEEMDKLLGNGSYATVVEMRFRGLKCAGKKVHSLFYDKFSSEEKERILQRFGRECQLLARLRHPNIVQFIGVCVQKGTFLPTLVMELLYCSLSECLDRYEALPKETALPILSDVATGLSYLHGHRPPVVHGCLSANNVLLTADMKAKISYSGMATVFNHPTTSASGMTECPGTPVSYMPPEAIGANPVHSTPVDCFSMGVMMIHVLSGRWPVPSELSPGNTDQLNEAQRRKEYLQLIKSDHPLMELIHHCLRNDPSLRSSAEGILSHLQQAASKLPRPATTDKLESDVLTKALRDEKQSLSNQVQELQKSQEKAKLAHSAEMEEVRFKLKSEVDGLKSLLKEKELEIEASKNAMNKVFQAKDKEIQIKDQEIQAKEQEIQAKEQEIQAKRQVIHAKIQEIQAKEQLIQAKEQLIQAKEQEIWSNMQEIKAKQQEIQAKEDVIHAKEQLIQAKEQEIKAKEQIRQQEIEAKLEEHKLTNHMLSARVERLTDQLKRIEALKYLPHPLNVQCKFSWQKCADMPEELERPQSTVIGDVVFAASCSGDLVHQYKTMKDEWSTLPSCPVKCFGLGQFSGKLIIVGGKDQTPAASCKIYQFNEESQKWEEGLIPPMPTPRLEPCVVTYQSSLIVCGGCERTFYSFGRSLYAGVVEVFDSSTFEWYTATPTTNFSGRTEYTVLQETCYFKGAKIVSASLPKLIQTDSSKHQETWSIPFDYPDGSSLTSMGGILLCLGGRYISKKYKYAEDHVRAYCPSTSSWLKIGTLPCSLIGCSTQLLPSGELMVIGGSNEYYCRYTKEVYICGIVS